MSEQDATEVARRQYSEQLPWLRPVILKPNLRMHFQMVALMGTAKHLRDAHGVEDPPSNAHALALRHMELHAAAEEAKP